MELTGEKIRDWRLRKGLSREDVAELCKVSYSTVHNWERNRNKPSGLALETLARYISGEVAVFPLTPLEERLLNELQTRRGYTTREELLKNLVLEAITEEEPPAAVPMAAEDRVDYRVDSKSHEDN